MFTTINEMRLRQTIIETLERFWGQNIKFSEIFDLLI